MEIVEDFACEAKFLHFSFFFLFFSLFHLSSFSFISFLFLSFLIFRFFRFFFFHFFIFFIFHFSEEKSFFFFSCISFKYVFLQALASEFNCFLSSRVLHGDVVSLRHRAG